MPVALQPITESEIEARTDLLIGMLPTALSASEAGRVSCEAVCAPMALLELVLEQVTQRLPEYLDPELCPDDAVRLLAELVGLTPDLGAVQASTLAQLRALIPSAIRSWRRSGTAESWRAFVRGAGAARSLITSWHDDAINISNAVPELIVLPGPGMAPAGGSGPYDYPDYALDVWVMDPLDEVDLTTIGLWIGALRFWGGRINVLRALLVEDLLNGRSLWRDIAGTSSWDQVDPALVLQAGSALAVDLDEEALTWGAHQVLIRVEHADVFRLLVHASAYALPFSSYVITVDPDADTVALSRVNAGSPPGTTLATAADVGLMPSATVDWRIDIEAMYGGVSIVVLLDGDEVLRHEDTSGDRLAAGTFGIQNHGAEVLRVRGVLAFVPAPDLVQVGV